MRVRTDRLPQGRSRGVEMPLASSGGEMVWSHVADLSTSLDHRQGQREQGGSAGGAKAWEGSEKTKEGNGSHFFLGPVQALGF